MRATPDCPSTYEIARAFIQELRTRFHIEPEVKWMPERQLDDVADWALLDHIRPETVTLTWEEFIQLASKALA